MTALKRGTSRGTSRAISRAISLILCILLTLNITMLLSACESQKNNPSDYNPTVNTLDFDGAGNIDDVKIESWKVISQDQYRGPGILINLTSETKRPFIAVLFYKTPRDYCDFDENPCRYYALMDEGSGSCIIDTASWDKAKTVMKYLKAVNYIDCEKMDINSIQKSTVVDEWKDKIINIDLENNADGMIFLNFRRKASTSSTDNAQAKSKPKQAGKYKGEYEYHSIVLDGKTTVDVDPDKYEITRLYFASAIVPEGYNSKTEYVFNVEDDGSEWYAYTYFGDLHIKLGKYYRGLGIIQCHGKIPADKTHKEYESTPEKPDLALVRKGKCNVVPTIYDVSTKISRKRLNRLKGVAQLKGIVPLFKFNKLSDKVPVLGETYWE